MRLNSLRSALLWMLIPVVALTSAISLWISGQELKDQVNAAFDRALIGAVKSIEANVNTSSGGLAMEQPFYMLEFMEYATAGRVYFRVASEDGLSEIGYAQLPLPANKPLQSGRPVVYDAEYYGEPLRLAAMVLQPSERLPLPLGSRIIVQVGESIAGRAGFIRSVMLQSLGKDVIIVLILILVLSAGTILALRPLKETSMQVRRRSSDDLQPIDEATLPREVRPLVQAINQHMERYARQNTLQRQFLDDTSHQLRTPLAVLTTQVDYAKSLAPGDEMKEVLDAIQHRLNNTIQLTNQMMALGRVHDAVEQLRKGESREAVDLCQIARNVADELLGSARRKRQDFGLALPDGAVTVSGIGWLIQQALGNMVSNAIKYSPNHAHITVSVFHENGSTVLQVEDNGPGMSPEDIALAGHRFRRGKEGRAQHGAGLGLAIVQTIAQINRADMQLRPVKDGTGLLIRLMFAPD